MFYRDLVVLVHDLTLILKFYSNDRCESNTTDSTYNNNNNNSNNNNNNSSDNNQISVTCFMSFFQTSEGMRQFELDVSTPTRLYYLLNSMNSCIDILVQKYYQFIGIHSSALWSTLIQQVKLGPSSVRKRSLSTIYALIKNLVVPQIIFDEIVDLFMSVLMLYPSNNNRDIKVDDQLGKCILEMIKICPKHYLLPISNTFISKIISFTNNNDSTFSTKSTFLMMALCELVRVVVIEHCADPRKEIKMLDHLVSLPQLRSQIVMCYDLAIRRTVSSEQNSKKVSSTDRDDGNNNNTRKRKSTVIILDDDEPKKNDVMPPNKKLKLANNQGSPLKAGDSNRYTYLSGLAFKNVVLMDLYDMLDSYFIGVDDLSTGINEHSLVFLNILYIVFEVSLNWPDYCPIDQLTSKFELVMKKIVDKKEQTILYLHHILTVVDITRLILCAKQHNLLGSIISLISKALMIVSDFKNNSSETIQPPQQAQQQQQGGLGGVVAAQAPGAVKNWDKNLEVLTCRCIEVSACLPEDDIAFDEVKKIFDFALVDNRTTVKQTAIRMIPLLIVNNKRQSMPLLNDFLVKLYQMIQVSADKQDNCTIEIAKYIGILACVATDHIISIHIKQASPEQQNNNRNSVYNSNNNISESSELNINSNVLQYNLVCSLCNNTNKSKSQVTEKVKIQNKKEQPRTLQWNMVWRGLCLSFLENKSISGEARALFLQSLPNIVNHVSLSDLKTDQEIFLKVKTFITDENHLVRKNVGIALQSLISDSGTSYIWSEDSSLRRLFKTDLKEPFDAACKDSNKSDVLETILMTYGQIGSKVQGDYLMCVVFALIETSICKSAKVRAAAYDQLVWVSEKQKGNITELLTKYQSHFYPWLIKKLNKGAKELVNEVATSIFDLDLQKFLEHALPFALPELVDSGDKVLIDCLKLYIPDWKAKFTRELHHVFYHLFLQYNDEDKPELTGKMKFLQEVMGSPWDLLVKAAQVKLINYMIIRLGETEGDEVEHERVKRALDIVAKVKEKDTSKSQTSQSYLTQLVTSQFLQIMDFLSSTLVKQEKIEEKQKVLKSLRVLIKLLDKKKLNSFRPKIMVTLKNALHFPKLVKEACSVWYTFITSLDVKHLGVIMNQIAADLRDYVNIAPEEVVRIYEYLFLENKSALKSHFSEVISLPDIPQLKRVREAIAAEKTADKPSWQQQVEGLYTYGLRHENHAVRSTALDKLRQVISEQHHDICNYVLSDHTSNDLVSKLMRVLLKDLSVVESRGILVKYAECLGDLGAIDPGRLDLILKDELPKELDEEEMVKTLVEKYLIPALHASHAEIPNGSQDETHKYDARTDRIGCAIQNLLKIMGGEKFLSKIKEREIIEPFSNSKYVAKKMTPSTKDIIFEKGMAYKDWLGRWYNSLLTLKDENTIFFACRQVVKDDTNTALFLLPYLVVKVLKEGNVRAIQDEMLAVLNQGHKYRMEEDSNNNHFDPTLAYLKEEEDENTQMCNQTVFLLVDLLNTWKELKKSESNSSSKSKSSKSKKTSSQSSTILEIPDLVMARASYRCRSYARALMYFEEYLRKAASSHNTDKAELLSANFPFLQKIYARIEDEPDGMKGIVQLRTPTLARMLSEQISDAERDKQWLEARMLYDQALQTEPNNMDLHAGRLKCMKNLGQLETMLSTCAESGQNSHMSNSFAIQSAWRLERWDLLGRLIQQDDDVREEDSQNGIKKEKKKQNQKDDYRFEVALGKLLYFMKTGDGKRFENILENTRFMITGPLAAASMESYQRCYPMLVKLHILSELEQNWTIFKTGGSSNNNNSDNSDGNAGTIEDKKNNLMGQWDSRIRIVQNTLKERDTIFNLRRVSLSDSVVPSNFGQAIDINASVKAEKKYWLQIAKESRQEKQFITATAAILRLSNNSASEVVIERAKLLWEQEQHHKAIQTIRKAKDLIIITGNNSNNSAVTPSAGSSTLSVKSMPNGEPSEGTVSEVDAKSKMTLLLADWLGQTGHNEAMQFNLYKEVQQLSGYWDKYVFQVGRHYDTLYSESLNRTELIQDETELSKFEGEQRWLKFAITHYARCVEVGSHFLFQSLPRMLSLWLDNGDYISKITDSSPTKKSSRKTESSKDSKNKKEHSELVLIAGKKLSDLNKCVVRSTQRIQSYKFYTCFTQLISRICHINESVWVILKSIIVIVLQDYLPQAIWLCIALTSKEGDQREKRINECLNEVIEKGKTETLKNKVDPQKFIKSMLGLCTSLEKLAADHGEDKKKVPKRMKVPKSLLDFPKSCKQVIIPTQKQLTATLPLDERSYGSKPVERLNEYNPFEVPITIVSFEPEVDVMSSLQKPKKITILGSDGNKHILLAKDGDDLRKDTRLLEICTLVNKLLKDSPESRRRRLHILTYAVTSIRDKCGLIEWVSDTIPLKHLLDSLYPKDSMSRRDVTAIWEGSVKRLEKLKTLRPHFPPVLYKWFLQNFPEPRSWFDARLVYTQTLAVMSMVGYILGLGDRHGENILLNKSTGKILHVDFGCLFWKGKTFKYPEKVPFRLTENMVDAMGVTGCEGVFRSVCEITLGVLRSNRETLVSVLETFLYDPLVEWNEKKEKEKKSGGGGGNNAGEQQSMDGRKMVGKINMILQGREHAGLPLSVEAQVEEQIQDSVSIENLSDMYVGWAAWI